MINIYIYSFILLLFNCSTDLDNDDEFNAKDNLINIIDGYIFLSDTHDLLHIICGEEEGNPQEAFHNYNTELAKMKNNPTLKPIIIGLNRISDLDTNSPKGAKEFDALVDYYQMGLQLEFEGILRGYGYSLIPSNKKELIKLKNKLLNQNFTL